MPRVPDHELLRLIGKGSYGEVWLARNVMGAWRAVKVVTRADFDSDRPFRREFDGIQRYEPISRTGEGLVPILHVGRHGEVECFYYVMELADPAGQVEPPGAAGFDPATYQPRTLRSDLKRLGRLPVEECVELGLALASGLSCLHRHGLVHRDVKPANIVFAQGRAKLADLGLVGEILGSRTFVGTEGYIPPEGPGAPGADLFALGKVLYEAATGLPPEDFPNPPADWLTGEIPHGALELHEVILRACESDPARRYRNAAELQADLALMQSGQSVRRARRLERRVKALRRIGLVAALAALLATALGLFAAHRARLGAENVRQANQLRSRAEQAEGQARAQLAEAQLARAGLERRTGLAGQRARSLELLREAAAFHTNRVELRSEAVAALALVDIREIERGSKVGGDEFATPWSASSARPRDLLSGPPGAWCALDGALTLYTRAHEDNSVRIHAWADDREIVTLEGLKASGSVVAPFSRAGHRLAGQSAWDAMVWETATGRRIFSRFVPNLSGVDLTPDGEFVALRAQGGVIKLVRVADKSPGAEIDVGFADGSFWFSPDSRELVAYGSGNCEIRRFAVATGQSLGRFLLPPPVCPIATFWSPDSHGLLIAGDDFRGYYVRFDAPQLRAARLEGHTAEIVAAAFHPTRPFVLTTAWDGSARVWDLRNGRALLHIPRAGYEPRWTADRRVGWRENAGVNRFRLAEFEVFEPEGVRLLAEPVPRDSPSSSKGPWQGTFVAEGAAFATATYDGVRLWDAAKDADPLFLDLGPTRHVRLGPNGAALWGSSARGLFRMDLDWNGSTRALSVRVGAPNTDLAGELALASASDEPGVLAAAGRNLVGVDEHGSRAVENLKRHTTVLTASPDGRWVLAGERGDAMTLWQRRPWKEVRSVPASVWAQAVFTEDSQSLVISTDTEARRERAADGLVEWRFRPARGGLLGGAVAHSPAAQLAAVAIGGYEAALLDARTGELLVQFRPLETGLISGLDFSPDGLRLAVTTQNHLAHIWDLAALRPRLKSMGLDWAGAEPSATARAGLPAISMRLAPKVADTNGVANRVVYPLDLSRYFTHTLDGFSSSGPQNGLHGLKPGRLVADGVAFDARGVIQLGGLQTEGGWPRRVANIPVGRAATRLHFLHAATWNGESGAVIGRYIARYANGETEILPLIEGANIHDWWIAPAAPPAGLSIAWRGANPVAAAAGCELALFHLVWDNPRPAEVIESLSLESGADRRLPFIVGISVE